MHTCDPGHWNASGLQVLLSEGKIKFISFNEIHWFELFLDLLRLNGSSQTLTALVVLIGAVATVISTVTHPAAGNAAVVPTLKLGG